MHLALNVNIKVVTFEGGSGGGLFERKDGNKKGLGNKHVFVYKKLFDNTSSTNISVIFLWHDIEIKTMDQLNKMKDKIIISML